MLRQVLKRFLLVVLAIGAVESLLVSCTSPSAPTPTPVAGLKATPRAVAGMVKFPFDNPAPKNFWREQMEQWGKETGFEATYEDVPFQQLHDFYQTALLAGTPDFNVFHVMDAWVAEWGPKGWLYPLDNLVTEEMKADYPPGVLEKLTATDKATGKEHLYGVPLYYWINAFYYRTDLFEEAGLEPPKTWSELQETAKKLQKKDEGTYGFAASLGGTGPAILFGVILRTEGGEVLTDGKPSFNNRAGVRALKLMVGLAQDGTLHPSSLEQSNSVASIDLFTQGETAMFFGPPPTLVMAADPDKSKVAGKVAVTLVPGGSVHRSATYHETGSRAIPAIAEDKETAWKYIEYVTQPEQMVEMALTLGRVPARKSALNDPRVQKQYPLATIVNEQLASGPAGMIVVHESATQIMEALSRHLTAALQLQKSPEDALADAEAEILKILEE